VPRRDSGGKRRWLDVVYEEARLVIEIDGAGHRDALEFWDDMDRDNDLKLSGYTVLRFPSYIVRYHPEQVAEKIRKAFHDVGLRI
jgi:very-short-patch-repair endonuclease